MCKNDGMDTTHDTGAFCPYYHKGMELIGRRWTGVILQALNHGTNRFSALTHTIPGLSDRLLSERLKELEAEGIIVRTVVPTTPVTITYCLTEKGKALESVMDAVTAWAQEWLVPKDADVDDATGARDTTSAA